MISAASLIQKFRIALDECWGYIYGKTHELWSDEKQKAYVRESGDDPDRRNSVLYGGKWAGHWVTDCSGLFKWAFSQLGGSIAHGSNSIWDKYCSAKGVLDSGRRTDGNPLLPGTAVFTTSGDRHNHIGLYVGDGNVIEAQGAQAGVVVTKVSNRKWTAWGELRNVLYGQETTEQGKVGDKMQATVVLPVGASGNTVNLRAGASRNSELVTRVPVGAAVEIISDQGQWCRIEFAGHDGWMMANYLEYGGQEGESGGDRITAEEREKIETALQEIEHQIDLVRETLGRG